MTAHQKSKLRCAAAAFLVGSLGLAAPFDAVAQQIDRLTVFSGELRRSIDRGSDNNLGSTDGLDFSTDEGRRGQLTGDRNVEGTGETSFAVPTPRTPIPLSPRIQRRAQAATPAPQIFNPESVDQATQQNIAVDPVQTGTTPAPETDPFAADGFRLGIFEADIFLEQTAGYSSNVSQNVGGEGGGFSQTDAGLELVSDWSRHELRLGVSGSYRRPFDSEEIDRPTFNANVLHRLDLIDGVTLTTNGFYTGQTQQFTSTTLATGAVDTPLVQNYGGGVELRRDDRKLEFTLRGGITRTEFANADLGGGVVGFQGDLNNNEYTAGLRVGYEISPAMTPFIEGQYSIQEFDVELDRNGNDRDSNALELRAGVEVDLGEKVQGEVQVGYVNESFEDPALEDLDGFTLNGTLNWSPERDTQIGLTLSTQTNNSINVDENGSLIYNAGLTAERQITDRWSINSNVSYQFETNEDQNTVLQVGVGTQYWVNRFLAITGDAEYLSFSSDAPQSDFDEFSVRAGVRLQR